MGGRTVRDKYRVIVKHNYLDSVFRGYTETTKDIPSLIDALSEIKGADPERIGITGRSGGGIVSLMAATYKPHVTAITSWARDRI